MENIKVGEYVRTKNGLIGEVVQVTDSGNYAIRIYNGAEYVVRAVITKHSFNLIDLIEVGDFINGYRILEIADMKNTEEKVFTVHRSDFKSTCKIWNEQDIETILTHEQYEQNCYKTTTKQQT